MHESNNQKFNHLKIHSQYSICEGAIKIENLKDICKEGKISYHKKSLKWHWEAGFPNVDTQTSRHCKLYYRSNDSG